MVEAGSWAWIEIRDSKLFRRPLPQNVVASVFVNREIYLVLANYGRNPLKLETAEAYVSCEVPSAKAGTNWQLEARSLLVLKSQSAVPG
jgi:hypothetical protein